METIFTVSEFIGLLNIGLKKSKAKIVGEVSEVKIWPSGHVYFSLKDEKGVMSCIIWKSRYWMFNVKLEEGLKIIAFGYPEIYPVSGRLSFIAETIEYAGEGALQKEYERLKKQLSEEGLFERKRPIPKYCHKIGLITSKQGAVLGDFLSNLGKFGFSIKMIDSRVEGQTAVNDLLASLKTMKKQDIEVLVLMRGGGSLESMMAFNNEVLVREIADFPVPVIAAIGHDKDVPLAALAADLAVSTPSIATAVLSESWKQALLFLERFQASIFAGYGDELQYSKSIIDKAIDISKESKNMIVNMYKQAENNLKILFHSFENMVLNANINMKNIFKALAFNQILSRTNNELNNIEKIIALNSPEHQLKMGYSIASSNGKIVKSVKDVSSNIDVRLIDGVVKSKVKNIIYGKG